MPIAAWDDIASIEDDQATKLNVARFDDIAAIEPPAPANVATFDDIVSIEPPRAPVAPPQSSAVPFTPDAIRPVPSHVPGAAPTSLVAPPAAKPSVLDAVGLQPRPGRLGSAKTGGMATQPPMGQGLPESIPIVGPLAQTIVQGPFTGPPKVLSGVKDVAHAIATAPPAQPVLARSRTGALYPSTARPPMADSTLAGMSNILEGTAETAAPFLLPAMAAAPVATPITLAATEIASRAAQKGAEAAGATPEQARLAGNVAGAIAMTGGAGETILERLRRGRQPLATEVPHAAESRVEPGRDLVEHQGAPVDREVPAAPGGGDRAGQQPPAPEPGRNVAHVDDIVEIEPPAPAAPEAQGEPPRVGVAGEGEPPRAPEAPPAGPVTEPAPQTAHVDDVVAIEPPTTPGPKEPRNNRAPAVTWDAVDAPTRRELRRIFVELDNTPYVPKNFNEGGRGSGGTLEVSGGSRGAPVYWDIVGGNPDSGQPAFKYTRGAVLQKLRAFLEEGKRSVVSDLAVDVAQRRGRGDRTLSPTTWPADAGDTGAIDVTPLKNLSPEQDAVQRKAITTLERAPNRFVDEYRRRFGNVVNADNAKELFPDYAASPAARTANDLAVHRSASALAHEVFRRMVQEPTPEGRDAMAVFTAGGTGSGKSTSLEALFPGITANAHVVYDSTLPSRADIALARKTGHQVLILLTERDVQEAFRATLTRATESGRPVTVNTHVATHGRAGPGIEALQKAFHADPSVTFMVSRNSTAGGRELVPLADWRPREYHESDVRAEALRILDDERAAGRVSDALDQAVRPRADTVRDIAAPEGAEPVRGEDRARAEIREHDSRGDRPLEPGAPPAEGGGPGAGEAGTPRAPEAAPEEITRADRQTVRHGGDDVSGAQQGTRPAGRRPAVGTESDSRTAAPPEDETLSRPLGSRRADASGALTPTPAQRAISLLPAGERQLRPSEIVREISKALDSLPVKPGVKGRRSVLGFYEPQSQVIRLKVANDLDTLAHELGHHIHETVIGQQLPPKVYRDELLPLGAPTSRGSYTLKQKLAEGQAEFTRRYLEHPAAAAKMAPKYFAAFEAGLAQHPELRAIVQKAQRQYIGFMSQDPVARGMAHIDFSGQDPNPKGDLVTRLQTAVVDDLAAVRSMVDDLRETRPIATSADGYVLARLARGSSAKADGFLRHGVRDSDGTFLAGPLERALQPVKSQPREFAGYLIASRVPELRARGMETALTLEEARAILAKYKSPTFDAARQAVYDYQNGLLEYARRSRAISKGQITAMRTLNEYYVPFQRVLDDVGAAVSSGSGKGAIANRANPTKRIKGSGRDIINPLESIVKNTHALVNLVEQNRAMLALTDMARATKGGGRYLEAVPKSQLRTIFNLDRVASAIKEELDAAGVDYPDNLDFDRMVQVFTPAQLPIGQRGIVTVLRDGEREWYSVNEPALFDAITAIGGKAPGIIAKLFMPPVRALRAGATLSLGFIGRNPIRDTFEATVNSRYGFRLGYDTLRGLFEFAKHGEDYQNFLNSGAGNSSLVGMDRNRIREELGRLGVRDRQQLVKDIVRSPIDLLRALSEAMEHATRLGEFKRALDVEGRDTEGYTRAALAARDVTIDFARGGAWSKEINHYTAFFNAGVQGGARLVEVFKADPVGATMRASAAMTVPAIALWVLNHQDPEYKELQDWEKNTYYHVPIGRGAGHPWVKIPKAFTLGAVFANPVEAALEYLSAKDPQVVDRLLPNQNAAWHLLGSLMFTAYMPALEAWTNYDTFRDRNIVNPDDLQLDTALQANRWTSAVAKFVGPRLQLGNDPRGGLAPAKLDHLIYGYGAGLAGGTVQAADTLFEKLGLARPKPAGGGGRWPFVGAFYREAAGADAQSLQDFYRLRDEVTGAVASLHRYEKGLQPEALKTRQAQATQQFGKDPEAVRVRVNQAAQTLSELRGGVDQVFANPRLTPAEKKELLDRLYEQMINVARAGLAKPPLPSRFDHPPAPALLEKLDHPLASPAQTSAAK